jgi:hypothetical protein
MKNNILQSFNIELQKIAEEYKPKWSEKMVGLLNASMNDPINFLGNSIGTGLLGALIGGGVSSAAAVAASALSKNRIPIEKSTKIINPITTLGASIGVNAGMYNFFRNKGIGMKLNPIYTPEAINKYITNKN